MATISITTLAPSAEDAHGFSNLWAYLSTNSQPYGTATNYLVGDAPGPEDAAEHRNSTAITGAACGALFQAAPLTWHDFGSVIQPGVVAQHIAISAQVNAAAGGASVVFTLTDATGAVVFATASGSSSGYGTISGSGDIPPAYQNWGQALRLRCAIAFTSTGPTTASYVRVTGLTMTLTYDAPSDFFDTLTLDDTLTVVAQPRVLPPSPGTGQPKRFSDGVFLDSCDPSDARATVCTRTTRTVPAALSTHLQGESLTLAYCLKLVRRDGTTLGFTTHDADLTFSAVTYEALNSMSVTALRQELGATVGNMDLAGLIRSDKVSTADLLAGRYDGAELTLYLVNWADLTMGSVTLARGWMGSVTVVDGQWRAEYRSIAQRVQQQIVELTSPTCRVAQLGDARCGITLANYQFSRTVTAVTDNRQFTFGSDTHASTYYAAGRVIWTSGLNSGLALEVKRHTLTTGSAVIEMQTAFPFTVQVGDTATLEAGCDRRLASCKGKFNNVVNFRGEPFMPGSGVLKRIQSLVVVG